MEQFWGDREASVLISKKAAQQAEDAKHGFKSFRAFRLLRGFYSAASPPAHRRITD